MNSIDSSGLRGALPTSTLRRNARSRSHPPDQSATRASPLKNRAIWYKWYAATTGLAGADAEKRADTAIANAKTAIDRSRRSTVILAFRSLRRCCLRCKAWAAAAAGVVTVTAPYA